MNKLIVALIGKSGSGKNLLARKLAGEKGINNIVPYTTRPIRENEIDGIDYHFIDAELFAERLLNGDVLEATYFNGWHYGIMASSLTEGVNVGVFDPEGFDCLATTVDKDILVLGFLLQCDDKIRLLRSLQREEHPDVAEIVRRYSADAEDFLEIENDDRLEVLKNETMLDFECNYKTILNAIREHGFKVGTDLDKND